MFVLCGSPPLLIIRKPTSQGPTVTLRDHPALVLGTPGMARTFMYVRK